MTKKIIFLSQSRTRPTSCPYCHKVIEGATSMADQPGKRPVPGNISLCKYCLELSCYDENMQLEKLQPEALEQIKADPATWEQIELYKRIFKKPDK